MGIQSAILLFEVIFNLAVSRTLLKQLMKQQIERFNKDVIYFDLVFEEDELYSKVDSSTNKAPIKYKDLKKIALFKKIVALGYLIQQKYRNDIRNMLP